ncbi:MAG: S8 family serine peptidase [Polyangiaceae bacterium]
MRPTSYTLEGEDLQRRPRLDARLATLVGLRPIAYGAGGLARYEIAHGFLRGGPLAFTGLRGSARELSDEDRILVFVTLREPGAFDRVAAEVPGLRLRSRARTIATADVRLRDLEALESHAEVVAIEWAGSVRPPPTDPDDSASPAGPVGSSAAHSAPAVDAGDPAEEQGITARAALGLADAPKDLDGRGVIVGVVDVEGLDLYHPAFVDAEGRSRVRALWDQRADAPSGDGAKGLRGDLPDFGYGLCYDRPALDEEVSPRVSLPFDLVSHRALKGSHGTKTAALAAGRSYRERGASGVAGGADLVFVNTWGSGAGSLGAMTELADGIAFVFEVAKADGKPCVVNVSLGDDMGPRDGRSPIERFLREIVGEGRAVVVAAGNSHGRNRHRGAALRAEETATFDIEVGPANTTHASIEIWSRPAQATGTLELRLEAPDGEGPTEPVPADGVPRIFDAGDTRALVLSSPDVVTSPGDRVIRIELLSRTGKRELLPGTWRLHLSASGADQTIDAWINHRYIRFAGSAPTPDANTLTTPSTSPGVISVGACDPKSGALYYFSGRGPGRGAESKPDVLAVGGSLIVASASTPVRAVEASGTSMSAALVTGAVALAFQRRGPDLTREQLLEELAPGAARRGSGDAAPVVNLARWVESEEPCRPQE